MKILAESLSRPRLSVAMIVRDEQEVLAESIESVGKIADEIVVLDTGSTDRTPELAARLGATVHRTPWENDFSAARNQCLRFVGGNWVLWLDAGERIGAQHAAELRRFLNEQANSAIAYSLWVEMPPRDEAASAEQCAQIRLLPTRVDLRFSGRVRETLDLSLQSGRNSDRRSALPDRSSPPSTRATAVHGQGPPRSGFGQCRGGSQRELVADGCCWRPAKPTVS